MSERFAPNAPADTNIIRDKYTNYADAEQWAACRDDLMAVNIALAPILAMYPRVKQDLDAAIDRCTMNITGKIGRAFVAY